MITHEPYDTKRIYSVKSSLFKDRVEIVVNDGREPTADELGLMAAAVRLIDREHDRLDDPLEPGFETRYAKKLLSHFTHLLAGDVPVETGTLVTTRVAVGWNERARRTADGRWIGCNVYKTVRVKRETSLGWRRP